METKREVLIFGKTSLGVSVQKLIALLLLYTLLLMLWLYNFISVYL